MAIKRVEIKNFLVFKGEFAADFCPGVNVLVGGNGTGKTTLLKVMYAVQERSGNVSNFNHIAGYFRGSFIQEEADEIYSKIEKLLVFHTDGSMFGYFNSLQQSLQLLHSEWDKDKATIGFIHKRVHGDLGDLSSVFIPEKDLLSNSRKLPESVEYGDLQFTRCEIDLIKKARVATSVPKQPLVLEIEKMIEGEIESNGEDFFVKRDGVEKPIPLSMEASGYRKFGLLATLIRNEQIKNGTVLFWDEPENSLNPELIPVLVDILLALQRSGVQIFLATHSEILASYFSVNRQNDDDVMFYSLYRDGEQIKYDSNDRFDLLNPNKLTAEPVKLYEKKLDRGLGDD